jgi:hypothetical protein
MTRRPASSLFASILLIAQLLMAPFTHAEAFPSGDDGCAAMAQSHAPAATGSPAGACAQMSTDADGHCQHHGHHCRTHAACSCPCAHTPALASVRPLILDPTPPDEVVSTLATPAFDPPLFKLLRPPK